MEKLYVDVEKNNSTEVGSTELMLSVRTAFGAESDVVVGYSGLNNQKYRLHTGDAVLYETPAGTFDIRVITQTQDKVKFRVTLLSPTLSIAGAFSSKDTNNTAFSESELDKIKASFEQVKTELTSRKDIAQEQIALINEKLDEIVEASHRLGRKDWINYAAGLLTSTCVSAAFTPGLIKTLFLTVNSAFSWLFGGALLLLE
ncbi:hypothetical protein [Pseudomonas sp. R3-52-08]|uniref:hypothetical protein n=1 Tax=Pseudomonas sp. R3-52-08 TaxID=1173284 RepID=UPI000F5718EE|nr:hypothetical protein [Pseudomonas sp. R3-52-08]AZF22433.1 hypothetical protein C4J91_3699 [Pseudomonas sp. R3-52-08]